MVATPSVPFARLPHALASDTRLTTTDRLVGVALLFWACDHPTCVMANRSLARYVGVSVPTVARSLRALAKLGYIAAEAVPSSPVNTTGRIVHLRWVTDPTILPTLPSRSDRSTPRATEEMAPAPEPSPESISHDGSPPSPVMARPLQPRWAPPIIGDGPPPSPVIDKEDRHREKQKNREEAGTGNRFVQRQRPEASDPDASEPRSPVVVTPSPILTDPGEISHRDGPPQVEPARTPVVGSDPPPLARVLERAMTDAHQAASMAAGPVPAEPVHLMAEGQRQALARMTEAERESFQGKSPGMRAQILAPFARGFEPIFFERITRGQLKAPRLVADPRPIDRSTPGLLAAVAEGDPRRVIDLAESLCRDLGGVGDRRRWGALHALAKQVLLRAVGPEEVLEAYRQAMGPRAVNRGAVFTTALRRCGWRPDATSLPAAALAPPLARAM